MKLSTIPGWLWRQRRRFRSRLQCACVQNLLKFTGLSRTVAPILKEIIKHGERLECRAIGMFVQGGKILCFFYM